jgi:molybdate transport system substrate-binding protein
MVRARPCPLRRPVLTITAGLVTLLLAACGSPSAGAPGASPSAGAAGVRGRLTVFAAASLTEAFTTLGRRFEQAHPGTTVRFSFGPSSGLATQIVEGAPADVFAAASMTTMRQAVSAGVVSAPTTFARNVAEIAVPPGNPAHITVLADLARPGVKVALCQKAVPCGAVAAAVLAKAGVAVTPVTQEADVKATLSKVVLGEVDAGIVYATDVVAAGDSVEAVPIPDGLNVTTDYPLATVPASANPVAARAFVAFVLSVQGAAVLAGDGFRTP